MDACNMFWGYLHISGRLIIKRYFDFRDIIEAELSDFVEHVYYPFEANNREEAKEKILKGEII